MFRRLTSKLPNVRNYASHSNYEGLSYDHVQKVRMEKLHPSLSRATYYKKPLLITKGKMQYLWDVDGKKYLDLFGGVVTISVGHCHPRITEAAKKQMDSLWHTTPIYMTSPIVEYAEKLTATFPEKLKVCYFVNSGSEANDLAIMMARLYTGNFDIVSLRNSYHGGGSSAAMSVTNLNTWRHSVPMSFGSHSSISPDPYRGPWGGERCRDSPVQVDRSCDCQIGQCKASDQYYAQMEDLLNYEVPKKGVAGFISESIQGVGGTVQYPIGFLKRSFDLIRSKGGVCIADEVQTGFGRTGDHFWAFQGQDAIPDIVVMAKGIANGYPMGAVVTTPEIANSLTQAAHFNTFGGNPIACTVASTVLDIIHEEKLQDNSLSVGTYFLLRLNELKQEFATIGDVRGKGLMIAIEMVEDKESKKPYPMEKMMLLFEELKDNGILFGLGGLHRNVFRITPPMCITKSDVDFTMDAIRRSFSGVH